MKKSDAITVLAHGSRWGPAMFAGMGFVFIGCTFAMLAGKIETNPTFLRLWTPAIALFIVPLTVGTLILSVTRRIVLAVEETRHGKEFLVRSHPFAPRLQRVACRDVEAVELRTIEGDRLAYNLFFRTSTKSFSPNDQSVSYDADFIGKLADTVASECGCDIVRTRYEPYFLWTRPVDAERD